MEEEFVSYPQALALKALGFTGRCLGRYRTFDELGLETHGAGYLGYGLDTNPAGYVLAPSQRQAFRFFRTQGYRFNIVNDSTDGQDSYYYDVWHGGQFLYESPYLEQTYEEMECLCLDHLLQIAQSLNLPTHA